VVTYHDHTIRSLTLLTAIVYDMLDILFHLTVIFQGVLRNKLVEVYLAILCDLKITHGELGMASGHWVTTVEVGPQGTTDEQIILILPGALFQKVDVVKSSLVKPSLQDVLRASEVAVIVLVVAHDHDHVREPFAHALEKLFYDQALSTFYQRIATFGAPNVSSHTYVSTQDQDIHIVVVIEAEITKLEMEV
jgi:hypothetical protein